MRNRFLIPVILTILISASVSGCIKKGEDDKQDGKTSGEAVIGTDGGWVITDDYSASLFFEENSLPGDEKISIKRTDELPDAEGIVPELGFEFGPDGSIFDIPAYIYINYSKVDLPEGVEEYMLRIYKVEGERLILIEGCEVDIDEKMIRGRIISFSTYVVLGNKIGFIAYADKDRIANDGKDEVLLRCQLRVKNKGDTKAPTGDPMVNVNLELDMYGLTFEGKKIRIIEPLNLVTNEYGYVSYTTTATAGGDPRYGIAVFSLSDLISAMVVVDIGFEWPYVNHFDENLGLEWSRYNVVMDGQDRTFEGPNPISIETSPNNKESFLGPFTSEKVVLTLENIPPHYKIMVEFDIIVIGPWMGGAPDKLWMYIDNDPDEVGYLYGSWFLSIQEDDFTGGYEENDIVNTLGYDTSKVVFTSKYGDEVILDSGDYIKPVETYIGNHVKSSIQLAFTVDERGFGEDSDVGQYWGIDDIYVRYVGSS